MGGNLVAEIHELELRSEVRHGKTCCRFFSVGADYANPPELEPEYAVDRLARVDEMEGDVGGLVIKDRLLRK